MFKFKDLMAVPQSGDRIFLLLGSNLGDTLRHLHECVSMIRSDVGTVIHQSSRYKTEPWGNQDQAWFLNQAIELTTSLSPSDLLRRLKGIEASLGRVNEIKWGPRNIDIDILLYGDLILDDPSLKIPHPLLADRRFALVPLAEIAGSIQHPVLKKSIHDLLNETQDSLAVERLTSDSTDFG